MTTQSSAKTAHQARLTQAAVTRKSNRPLGNYQHSEFQWGVIGAIHAGPPPTVDVYLDGSQNTNNTSFLTKGVKYLSSYVPAVNDVVLLWRGEGRSRTSRVVLGKLNGSASPYPLPLGGIDSHNRFLAGPNAVWGGPGVPSSSLGQAGDYYFRTDTPGTAGQRLYVNIAGVWTATTL